MRQYAIDTQLLGSGKTQYVAMYLYIHHGYSKEDVEAPSSWLPVGEEAGRTFASKAGAALFIRDLQEREIISSTREEVPYVNSKYSSTEDIEKAVEKVLPGLLPGLDYLKDK